MKAVIIVLLICFTIPCLGAKALTKDNNKLHNEQIGVSFSKLPSWFFIRKLPRKGKLFDVVKFYKKFNITKSKRSIMDHIAARLYLEIVLPSTTRIIPYAKKRIRSARLQGFSVITREVKTENKRKTLYYLLFHKSPDKHERNIWTSIRFFRAFGNIYIFSGAAHSKQELKSIDAMFRTLQFFKPKKSDTI